MSAALLTFNESIDWLATGERGQTSAPSGPIQAPLRSGASASTATSSPGATSSGDGSEVGSIEDPPAAAIREFVLDTVEGIRRVPAEQ